MAKSWTTTSADAAPSLEASILHLPPLHSGLVSTRLRRTFLTVKVVVWGVVSGESLARLLAGADDGDACRRRSPP